MLLPWNKTRSLRLAKVRRQETQISGLRICALLRSKSRMPSFPSPISTNEASLGYQLSRLGPERKI